MVDAVLQQHSASQPRGIEPLQLAAAAPAVRMLSGTAAAGYFAAIADDCHAICVLVASAVGSDGTARLYCLCGKLKAARISANVGCASCTRVDRPASTQCQPVTTSLYMPSAGRSSVHGLCPTNSASVTCRHDAVLSSARHCGCWHVRGVNTVAQAVRTRTYCVTASCMILPLPIAGVCSCIKCPT